MTRLRFYIIYPALLAAALIFAVLLLGRALLPLLIAAIFAYIFQPVVQWIERKNIPRSLAILTVIFASFFIISIVTFIVIPILYGDIQKIVSRIPDVLTTIVKTLEEWARLLGVDHYFDRRNIERLIREQVEGLGGDFISPVADIARRTIGGFMDTIIGILNLFLIPVFFYFILSNYENMREEIVSMVPAEYRRQVGRFAGKIDRVLGGFIRGQLIVCLIVGVLSIIGFWIAGVPTAFAVGVVAGILNIIPYIGPVLGYLAAVIVSLSGGAELSTFVILTFLYVIIQSVESALITPKIVGEKVGIPPLMALIAVLIGGNAFGIVGAIFATPSAGIVRVIYYDLKRLYLKSLDESRRTPS